VKPRLKLDRAARRRLEKLIRKRPDAAAASASSQPSRTNSDSAALSQRARR